MCVCGGGCFVGGGGGGGGLFVSFLWDEVLV